MRACSICAANEFLGIPITPAILFFLLGVVAALVKSDLEIPRSVIKILSLNLLFVAYTFIHKLW